MGKQICSLFVALGHTVNIWQNSEEKLDHTIDTTEINKLSRYFNNSE